MNPFEFALLIACVILFALLILMSSNQTTYEKQTRDFAIKNQCAVYHPKTGAFTWKHEWTMKE